MPKSRTETVDLFRFQLLPLTGEAQLSLLPGRGPRTAEEARARKNEFFALALRELPELHHRGRPLTRRILVDTDEIFAFRLGAKKKVERITRELKTEELESWPNVIVAINNDPDIQLIGVSRDRKAFSSSSVVIAILRDALNRVLHEFILAAHVEALFEKSEFWALVREYESRVLSARFELVSPNMASISRRLELDLSALNRATNSHQTNLEFNSAEDSALELDESNATINSLVDYAAEGGGDVSLKIKGLKKRVRTSKGVRSIEIEEVTFEGGPESIAEALRTLLR